MTNRLARIAKRWLLPGVAAVAALVIVVTATMSHGFPVRELDLNDTGIWISNDADGELGRINKAVGALDARLGPPGTRSANYQLDVLQDGNLVLGWHQSQGTAFQIDTSLAKPAGSTEIAVDPTNSLAVGGGTVAKVDRAGRVWATRYDPLTGEVNLGALDSAVKPLAELGLPADAAVDSLALTVSQNGTVEVVGVNQRRITVRPDGVGFADPSLSETAQLNKVALTTVGDHLVMLDTDTGKLILPGGKVVALPADQSPRLQQPGPAADWVLVATRTSLLRVGLSDGLVNPVDTGGNGEPAAPVRLGGCDFSAWAGAGRVSRACDNTGLEVQQVDRTGGLIRPAFRVNHSLILLNDQANGRAWDLDAQRSVDNWPDLRPQANQHQETKQTTRSADAKPRAVDDDLKARPDRTTVLHVLDNDLDSAGGVLAITSLNTAGLPKGAGAHISPDGQTVLFTLPDGAARARFTYVVSNGTASDEGAVVVSNAGSQESAPHLRPNFQPIRYSAASFGTLAIPVTTDWRDDEGDPVTVLSASAEDGSAIPVTGDGVINFTADGEPVETNRRINYQVTDGSTGATANGTVVVRVLAARKSVTTVPAVAEPDIARGEVGKPISIMPLANDIPGADPRDLSARLRLNAEVSGKANIAVTTDTRSGQVLAVAQRAGSYFLSYSVAYGNAPVASGRIRVDASAAAGGDRPVAMPDQVAVRGQAPVLVDVLANDYDPAGGLLTVQAADPAQPTQVAAQVVAGRWLRILPTDRLSPNPQAVHYTISNGSTEASGDVLLTQLAAVKQDAVLARKDNAVVRVGDSVLIPVLANDSSLSGQALSLTTDGLGAAHDGELPVADPSRSATEDQGDVGNAYVWGGQVRYVAPATATGTRQVMISYTAQTSSGDTAQSQVMVTIKPEPSADDPDQAPNAGSVEARVVAGSRVKIPIPTSGQDPDGDTVTVVGISAAPKLGRVVATDPKSITYEAYPTEGVVGTDSFGYLVTDRYGRTGTGSIRVAVSGPGQTQPPVAIDDVITAAPGAQVEAHVLANDMVGVDDDVAITDLAKLNQPLPQWVSLDGDTGPISVQAPGAFDQPRVVNYSLTGNGGTGPVAAVKILAKEGFNNPPIVVDQTATIDGEVATAHLLERAWDVDGPVTALTPEVLAAVEGLTVVGDEVSVPVLDHPQAIPFRVTDAGGAVSAAVLYVPTGVSGAPRLRGGGRIDLPSDTSRVFTISDFVESPRTQIVRMTGGRIEASPVGRLSAEIVDATHFRLTSSGGYVGPGSVSVEVMDAESQTDDGVLRALVSIPVQVGDPTPVLRCPSAPQRVVQGGEIKDLDIASLCHVWLPDPDGAVAVTFDAQWDTPIGGVTASSDGARVRLQASGGAAGGSKGSLSITAPGTRAKPSTLTVAVVPAPPPQLRSIRLTDIKAGTPVPVFIGLDSPLLDAQTKVLSVEKSSGGGATATHDDTSVVITADPQTVGEVTYRIRATDLASDPNRKDRWVEATITVVVYAPPDAPGRPQNGPTVQSHAATISWQPGNANGAPVDGYEVRIKSGPGAGRVTSCRSTPCQIRGLTNGEAITVEVRAHNKADWSPWSLPSAPITPDIAPGSPAWVKVSDPQDSSVLVSWGPVFNDGSPLKVVHVMVDGVDHKAAASATSLRVATPSNNVPYTFSVAGENSFDIGPAVSRQGQSSGKPAGLVVTTPQPQSSVGATTRVAVSWTLASVEGPGPATYSVVRSDGKSICSGATAKSCIDDKVSFDGTRYSYRVTATNATGGSAHSTSASSPPWTATGTPDDWGAWSVAATGVDGRISLSYDVPASRGSSSTVSLLRDGAPFRSMPAASPSGGAVNTSLSGLTNGASYSLSLQVCNEAGNCKTSSSHSVMPYGPLSAPSFTTPVSGDTVSVSATGDGNGANAKLRVSIGSKTCESGSSTGALSVSCSLQVGWSKTVTVTVTVIDTSSHGRASVSRSRDVSTGAQPAPPTVIVTQGAHASISNASYECTSSRCHWVVVELQNFSGPATCRISDSDLFGAWGNSWTQGNVVNTTDKLYGGYWIEVTCDGVSSGRVPWGG